MLPPGGHKRGRRFRFFLNYFSRRCWYNYYHTVCLHVLNQRRIASCAVFSVPVCIVCGLLAVRTLTRVYRVVVGVPEHSPHDGVQPRTEHERQQTHAMDRDFAAMFSVCKQHVCKIKARIHSDVTELNRHGLVLDELTNAQAHWSLVDAYVCVFAQSPMPLDGAYCNALLLAHWSVRQKPNHVSSV